MLRPDPDEIPYEEQAVEGGYGYLPPPPGKPSFFDKIKPFLPAAAGIATGLAGKALGSRGMEDFGFSFTAGNMDVMNKSLAAQNEMRRKAEFQALLDSQKQQLEQDQNLISNVEKEINDLSSMGGLGNPQVQEAIDAYEKARSDGRLTAKEAEKISSQIRRAGDISGMRAEYGLKQKVSQEKALQEAEMKLAEEEKIRQLMAGGLSREDAVASLYQKVPHEIGGQKVWLSPSDVVNLEKARMVQEGADRRAALMGSRPGRGMYRSTVMGEDGKPKTVWINSQGEVIADAAATVYDPTGMPSLGGQRGYSLQPPPTVPQGAQEILASYQFMNNMASNIFEKMKKVKTQGPIMGSVTAFTTENLRGAGASPEEIDLVNDLRYLMDSGAFAEGGKVLSPTEFAEFKARGPTIRDTPASALIKLQNAMQYYNEKMQTRLQAMPERQRAQLTGLPGAKPGLPPPPGTSPGGKRFTIVRVQ